MLCDTCLVAGLCVLWLLVFLGLCLIFCVRLIGLLMITGLVCGFLYWCVMGLLTCCVVDCSMWFVGLVYGLSGFVLVRVRWVGDVAVGWVYCD